MTRHVNYLAIGAGSGGIASANRAAMRGASAAVIEAKAVGGTCVNVGCVPKKVMWYGAHIAEALKFSAAYGFDIKQQGFDWATLVKNREAYIERIHASYQGALFDDHPESSAETSHARSEYHNQWPDNSASPTSQ